MTRTPLRVLIIGAGIGGLALGQRLVPSGGIAVKICDRNRHALDRLDGYRINITPSGSRALHACLPPPLWTPSSPLHRATRRHHPPQRDAAGAVPLRASPRHRVAGQRCFSNQ